MSRSYWMSLSLMACVVVMASGCDASPSSSSSTEVAPSSAPQTTAWQRAVAGLEQQLANAERKFKRSPTQENRAALVGYLLETSTRLGRVSALDRALRLAEEGVARAPQHPRPRMLHAQALGSVHRFTEALEALDAAEARGASEQTTRPRRATVWMALGRLDEACPVLTREREKFANHVNLTLEAMCLGKMGKLAAADAAFAKASSSYRNVSPFIRSWMAFERGSMWDRAGRSGKAKSHYQQAVELMPLYAHAVGHLAYTVPPHEARALLQPVIASSDDPEYVGALAHAHEREKQGTGSARLAEARRGYERLMARQPLAFADHAGWFFLAVAHDPERALAAAELNLSNRRVAEAYELHIAALIAVDDPHAACESAEAGLALAHGSRGLRRRAADAFERCGMPDRARTLRDAIEATDMRLAHHP